MKVRQLITALRKLDPDMPVVCRHDDMERPHADGLPRYDNLNSTTVPLMVTYAVPVSRRPYQFRAAGLSADKFSMRDVLVLR